LQGQEQARAPQGSQPLPRQAPRPRRTSQRPAQALEDPDQATLLPTPSRSPGQGHPRPPEPRAQPTLKKVQFAANLTAVKTVAILDGRPIPIGSLLYAVSFTWIDLVNEHLGRRCARWLVVSYVGVNALIILWFQLYVHLPGTSAWNMDGGRQEAVAFVMGTTPRVLIASLVTMY